MTANEQVLIVASPTAKMLGILSLPATGMPVHRTGVVIVTGGAQYRTGSHRQFVQMARALATAGYPVLRFDFPGMGDSPGAMASFEYSAPHIAAAIQALVEHATQVQHVAILGLCDGASASLLYLQTTQDPRVSGIALLNPWVRTEAGLARTHIRHYYRDRILQPAFWRKLVHGKIGWQALHSLAENMRRMHQQPAKRPDFVEQMVQGLQSFSGTTLILLSERDLTAAEFSEMAHTHPVWHKVLRSSAVSRYEVKAADHTFSSLSAHQEVVSLVLAWLEHMPTAKNF